MELRVLDEGGVRGIHDTALMMLDSVGMVVAGGEPRGRCWMQALAKRLGAS